MKDSIFTEKFWIKEWEKGKKEDTFNVHKGFAGSEFWDKASLSYNTDSSEISLRGVGKTIDIFKKNDSLFPNMKILDIGCGTGLFARSLAKQGAFVTAIDFSPGMLKRFKKDTPKNLKDKINIIHMDWRNADIKKMGWEDKFDLVIAFMSPAVSTPGTLFKMMEASNNACAVKGWAAKRTHPLLDVLWEKIMGAKLDDKPQTLIIKFNLLFSMGFFPELYCDTISWEQKILIKEEIDNKLAFFKRISNRSELELKKIITDHIRSIAEGSPTITKKHRGMTGTIFWKIQHTSF